MTDVIKKFKLGARWNAFESIFYKAVLATHQTCLFYFASRLIYGFSSLIFAIVYLTVELINLGFDHSVAQLSVSYFNSKKGFWRYFMPQLILQLVILGMLFLFIITHHNLVNEIFLTKAAFLNKAQWLLLATIIICESIRKTLRIIAQLLFLNKPAAILESSLILIYVASFWMMVLAGYQIDIYTIYLPLLLQSLIGITGSLYFVAPKLNTELQTNFDSFSFNWQHIFYARIQSYLYQLSEMLFSSNFLIYLFNSMVGLIAIGPIKLANYLAVFLKALLERTFGLTSLAIFAKNKHLLDTQKAVFAFAQRKLNLTLIGLFLIFGACTMAAGIISNNSYLALLFFGFTLINNFLIIYEQLFLIYNKIIVLFLLNFGCILIFSGFIYIFPNINIAQLIILLAALRILTLMLVKASSQHIFASK